MTRRSSTIKPVPVADIDLDAILQQHAPTGPQLRTVKLFGEIHHVLSPNTPAGILQVMEWRRSILTDDHAAEEAALGEEGRGMVRLRTNVLAMVTAMEALIPSLNKHREAMMNLTYAQINALAEQIHLDELLEEVMSNLGIGPGRGEAETAADEAEGAEGN